MTTLHIRNVGQIVDANLTFGDLTVLVGPQATGKSIALQLLKLMVDAGQVQAELSRYGLDWEGELPDFLDAYLGEGMRADLARQKALSNGRARLWISPNGRHANATPSRNPFSSSRPSACSPCATAGLARSPTTLPATHSLCANTARNSACWSSRSSAPPETCSHRSGALKREFRDLLQENVFSNFHLSVDKVRSQKRLVLGPGGGDGQSALHGLVGRPARVCAPVTRAFTGLCPPRKCQPERTSSGSSSRNWKWGSIRAPSPLLSSSFWNWSRAATAFVFLPIHRKCWMPSGR